MHRWGLCTALSLRRALPLVAALLMLSSIGLPEGLWPWSLRAQRSGSGGGGGGGVGLAGIRSGSQGTAQTVMDGDEDDAEPALVLRQVCCMKTCRPYLHASRARPTTAGTSHPASTSGSWFSGEVARG